jgi:hypothetical protein
LGLNIKIANERDETYGMNACALDINWDVGIAIGQLST